VDEGVAKLAEFVRAGRGDACVQPAAGESAILILAMTH
jgi:hypothetical protein